MEKTKLAVAISGLLLSIPVVQAADNSQPRIEEVIVTGTADGREVRKLDASFAVTNVSEEDIIKFAPKSTADLLKTIPGVWAESSGGVSGANVFVRGFPAGGDAPFLTVQLEGAPVFPPPTVSFLENTTLFRIDETVQRVEGLRGGPQSVQDNGQPGLTTNFILKEGGEETEGTLKYTTSDYDLQRVDAVLSGQLADDLYYMVGGYVKSTPGLRDAGFNAEEGKQFTVKISKDFDAGTFSVYHRAADDHGVWFLPAALNVPGIDASYTQVGTLNRQGTIQFGSNGETKSADLGEGRGWDGSVSGANLEVEVNQNWTLTDSVNFTTGAADTFGLVPNGGAVNVAALFADPTLDANAVVTGPMVGGITGRSIAGTEYIQQFGLWEVRKDIESFTNNLAMTGSFDSFEVTAGIYTSTSSVDEWWSIGNQEYYVVAQGGERISGTSIACNAAAIDSCGWSYDINARGDARTNAYYVSGNFDATAVLKIDAGIRVEDHAVEYSVDEGLDGIITKQLSYDENETSYTIGVNYSLNDDQGIFVRYSKGFKFPYFDDFRDNFGAYTAGEDLIKEIDQYEFGYKAEFETTSLYATFFNNEITGDTFTAVPGGPTQVFTNEAYGVELDAKWYHDSGFALAVNGTFQETEITQSIGNDGNEAQRQPGLQFRLSPSYDFEVGSSLVTIYGGITQVDDRYADNANTVVLDSYTKVDFGVIYDVNESLVFQLAADNITGEEGLTEGDPRNPAAPNGRYIMPKSVRFSVGYNF